LLSRFIAHTDFGGTQLIRLKRLGGHLCSAMICVVFLATVLSAAILTGHSLSTLISNGTIFSNSTVKNSTKTTHYIVLQHITHSYV
jgi:hypothetical protein